MNQTECYQALDPREEVILRARRESLAGKLLEKVPGLSSLRLAVAEARASGWHGAGHVRHVDLARAVALFEMPCSYAHCQGGGYDLTGDVLAGLRLQRAKFEGKQACAGRCGEVGCTRLIHFEVRATYLSSPNSKVESFAPEAESRPRGARAFGLKASSRPREARSFQIGPFTPTQQSPGARPLTP